MRQGFTAVTCSAVLACLAGCARQQAVERGSDDVLVLELGGSHASLRAALVAMGREVRPSRVLPPKPGQAVLPARPAAEPADPVARGDGEHVPEERGGPAERAEPVEPVESEWTTVPLRDGETLIHVAKRHLGDGRRFLDLLAWNGWTEADARRLPVGQAIRVKRSELR